MSKKCFFCGVVLGSNRSKEHKVPEWLQKYLDIVKIPMNFELTSHDGIKQEKRTYSLSSDAPKTICKKCNNNWMSDLETSAAPLLKNLFEKKCNLASLSSEEKIILGRWIVKTAYIFLNATEFSDQIPKDHTSYLMNKNKVHENVYVVGIQIISSEKIGRCARFLWQTFPPIKSSFENKKICKESYKIGLHVSNYFFIVVYFPLSNWYLGMDHRYYVSLIGEKEKIAWLTTESRWLEFINDPKDGLNAYVNGVMAVSENIISSRPTLTDLSGKVWRII